MTPHPSAMGSALTNPWLTTDFSEALLEFITPHYTSIDEALGFLRNTHAFFYSRTSGENIWAGSMPCRLPDDDMIPVAQYGSSNIARMKTVYRKGLVHRYGSAMQTVAGIHYNFSLPADYWPAEFEHAQSESTAIHDNLQDHISQRYLDLIRNFRRNYWVLIYLFGSAPCFDRSFVRNREHQMQSLGDSDYYLPYATSLRMGDLGYQSVAQKSLFVCYNELETYINTLGKAIHEPYPEYEKIGTRQDGEYLQLNTSLLQIENEFYSPIRPKRVTRRGQTPLAALRRGGIEYVEVRCLDVNPFLQLGIDTEMIRFLDTFLVYCLVKDSTLCNETEFKRIAENQSRIVNLGRDPDIKIYCGEKELLMRDCASGLLNDMLPVATLLDEAHQSKNYSGTLDVQRNKVKDDSLTPSARLLKTLADNNQSLVEFTLGQSVAFAAELKSRKVPDDVKLTLQADINRSIEKQQELEQDTTLSFEDYLAAYYNQ